ncbi:MAG TPA: adenylate/guanylate cyclase domain-containing protein [bacterium]|nr:adenylate/guanylate cyclase domain-containing protein [bacterium]
MKLPFKLPNKAEDRNKILAPAIGFVLAAIFSLLFVTGIFGTIQNIDLDLKFKSRQQIKKPQTNKDILNVLIDDSTLEFENAYPDDPLFYINVIDALGQGRYDALATVFSIDYSRPFGRKVELESKPIISEYIGQSGNILLYDSQIKGQMLENIKFYHEILGEPDAASYAGDLAVKFEEMVYNEEMNASMQSMSMVADFTGQIRGLGPLAPDREQAVGMSAETAGNVYLTYDAKSYVETPYGPEDLKNNATVRQMFERIITYPTRNRPEDPRESVVFDAYGNFLIEDFDYLLGEEGQPFEEPYLGIIKKDRELKVAELDQFHAQNDKLAFDIPDGVEENYVHLKRVMPVVPQIGMYTAGQGPRKAEFSPKDGTLRMIAPVFIYDGKMYPHIDFLLAMKYLGVDKENVVFEKRRIILKNATHPRTGSKKDIVIPLRKNGTMLVNWAGVWADTTTFDRNNLKNIYTSINRHQILLQGREDYDSLEEAYQGLYDGISEAEAEYLVEFMDSMKGRIVIVGLTAEGTADMNPTPLEARYKILGLHSNVINTIIEDLFISELNPGIVVIIFFALAIGLGFMGGAVRHKSAAVVALIQSTILIATAAVYSAVCIYAFAYYRIDIPVLVPLGLVVLTFLVVFLYRFLTEEQEKKKMKGMFSTYVNPQVVDTMLQEPDKLKLGGERTIATVYFSDVAGFTSISESLTPEELVDLLNEYLTAMTNILLSYGGTLDKYIGDAIVGIYGAPIHFPDHAKNACFAALDMQAKIAEMRIMWKEQGKHELQVRSGLNTGSMIAGNMGSTRRFNYTVMGPEVEFGEHLESSGKKYLTQTTISEFTRAECDDHIITRLLDISWTDAYDKPVKIYELMAKKEDGLPDIKLECCNLHEQGVIHYFKREFQPALDKFNKIFELFPANPDDEYITKFLNPTKKMIQNTEEALKNPPDEKFDQLIELATHRKDLIF